MKGNQKPYSMFHKGLAIFMTAALLWLTISIPFVYASQQQFAKQQQMGNSDAALDGGEEESNPLGNTTEEKSPNSTNSFSEEYLHDQHATEHFFSLLTRYHKCENADTYTAFHGEVQVPPPNIA